MLGNQPRARGLFIARTGILVEAPGSGYLSDPDEVRFNSNFLRELKKFARVPYHIFLIGNEEAVSFGHITLEQCQRVQGRIEQELRANDIPIARNFVCPYHPKGTGDFAKDSVFRMPNIGVFKAAQQEFDVDLAESWLFGERTHQILSAERAGCRSALVKVGAAGQDGEYPIEPDAVAEDPITALQVVRFEEHRLMR